MIVSIIALIFSFYMSSYISFKIKEIKTYNKNQNDYNYWMFSYDFKTEKKESIFDKDSLEVIHNNNKKDKLIVLLYITHAAIFLYVNYFLTKVIFLL